MTDHIMIVGAGMCGLATAAAISQAFSSPTKIPPRITIYELRATPSTLGGPVNLTPKALRCLDILGILDELKLSNAGCEVESIQIFSLRTGAQISELNYNGPDGTGFGGYKGWRVMRYDLLQAMLRVVGRLVNVEVKYGKKAVGVEVEEGGVKVQFDDGTSEQGNMVLGCDGIHSSVRSLAIEPERSPRYSGIAAAYGFVEMKDVVGLEETFFNETGLVMSRYGSTLTTFCDKDHSMIYVVIMMPIAEQGSREGWKTIGRNQEMVQDEAKRRAQQSAIPEFQGMVEGVQDWTLYPVSILPPNGRWFTERVLLLGDAAHAMPPKGESIGHALEDAIKFAKILSQYGLEEPKTSFEFYEGLQRQQVEDAYKVSSVGWVPKDDLGAIGSWLWELFTPAFLWWTRGSMEKEFLEDPTVIKFPGAD